MGVAGVSVLAVVAAGVMLVGAIADGAVLYGQLGDVALSFIKLCYDWLWLVPHIGRFLWKSAAA